MIVGIDLGTTNSLVSYRDGDEWKLLVNEFGSNKTPSVISFDEDGTYYVGEIAHRRKLTHPNQIVSLFKRGIGKKERYEVNGEFYTSQMLSALLIEHLVKQAEKALECEVEEVVISVPTYFDDLQRLETKKAGAIAGVHVDRIINEPSAAALAYYMKEHEEGYYLVFDFGGGTLDISIIDIFGDIVDVIGVSGDTALGGLDIDYQITDHFRGKHPDLLDIRKEDLDQLQLLAESAKIDLSEEKQVTLEYRYNDHLYTYDYDNQILTDICSQILIKIKRVIETALVDAGITADDLDQVICVGGSSYVKFVQQYLQNLLYMKPKISINPEEVVAMGVGIVASIKERYEPVKDIVLMDVCPFSLGIEMIDDRFGVIIPKNSSLPISKTNRYFTTADDQRRINVQVYQGDSMLASRNQAIGSRVSLKVPKREQGMSYVDVTLSYDLNGILAMHAKTELDEKDQLIITNENLEDSFIKKQRDFLENLSQKKSENLDLDLLMSGLEAIHRNADLKTKLEIDDMILKFNEVLSAEKPTLIARSIKEMEKYVEQHSISVFNRKKDSLFLS